MQVACLIEADARAARLETTSHPGIVILRVIWVIGKSNPASRNFNPSR
jgi:hypothetical protein